MEQIMLHLKSSENSKYNQFYYVTGTTPELKLFVSVWSTLRSYRTEFI